MVRPGQKEMFIEFPPGRYIVGDPCYALWDHIYDEVWGGAGYVDGQLLRVPTEAGEACFGAVRTCWGDGAYDSDKCGLRWHEFGVDSGTIGLVDVRIADPEDVYDREAVFDFPNGATLHYDPETGEIAVGATFDRSDFIVIYTDRSPYSYDPFDEEEWRDDDAQGW